jgi:uncharacterized surface protein with fasciclin (FAS1) repeats
MFTGEFVMSDFSSMLAISVLSGMMAMAFGTPLAAAEPIKTTSTKDIVETAMAAGNFKTLVSALKAADLVETLQGKGPYTVFAPSDEAFAKLPKETLESLLKPENKKKLAAILTYHVVSGKVLAADAMKLTSADTVQGTTVKIAVKDGKVYINNATVTGTDILCENGVIHVIDTVLMPATK